MQSATADEAALQPPSFVNSLLVLWQDPSNRRFVPIGRFTFDGEAYSFAYTRAAANLTAFRPLPGMPDVRRRYTSVRIPALFNQRVMSSSRNDFANYARGIGLDPATATPWEQIVHSGGTRAGDTLQFMPLPIVDAGRARARFFANGVKYVPTAKLASNGRTLLVSKEEHEQAIRALKPGDRLRLMREDNNPVDQYACLIASGLPNPEPGSVLTPAKHDQPLPLGWVPRVLSEDIWSLLQGTQVSCSVIRVGPPGAPSHQRIVLDLDHPAPPGFRFDARGDWRPLVDH